jgi:hypothetical protein
LLLALTVLVAACSGSGSDVQVFGGKTDIINNHLSLHDGQVTVRVSGAPNAEVSPDGAFTIDGKDVPVNNAQRALLKRYNASAQAMREHAIATGKAGVATATQAMSAAAGRITGAQSADATKDQVETAAADVKQAAAKICEDLAAMKAAQDELGTQLDAFKPYANALDEANVEKCRKDTAR